MRKCLSSVAFAALTLFGSVVSAAASPIVYSAFDSGAGSANPHPNSDAMAATFAAAVGTSTLVNFELSPLGAFTDLAIASGVTINGSDTFTTIRNSPVNLQFDSVFGYNTTSGDRKSTRLNSSHQSVSRMPYH